MKSKYKRPAPGTNYLPKETDFQVNQQLLSPLGSASISFDRFHVPAYKELHDQVCPCTTCISGKLYAEGKCPRFYYPIPVASSRTFANIPV